MKKIFAVLLMLVSLPTVAAETGYYRGVVTVNQNTNTIYDPTRINPYEGLFIGQAAASTPMLTIPIVSKGKFSLFGAIDHGFGGWDKKTRTLRLSDELGIGSVKNGSLGRGVGFKYSATPEKTYYIARVRSIAGIRGGVEEKKETITMIGVHITFP